MNDEVEIAIIGAGPYGLATAAHLQARGREVCVFGEPLQFWAEQTPVNMWLRSPHLGSDIGHPHQQFRLPDYELDSGNTLTRPIHVDRFIDYGRWFQRQAVPNLDRSQVRRVARADGGFVVETESRTVHARRVVVAAGVGTFAHEPEQFRALGPEHLTHTMNQHDLSHLAGKRVSIVGRGQSALETAALLYEQGATVDVLVRAPLVRWLTESSWKHTTPGVHSVLYAKPDVGPALRSHLVAHPRIYTMMSRDRQDRLAVRSVRPAGAGWLRPRLANVPLRTNTSVDSVEAARDGVKLTLSDGSVDLVDHVMVGTGYRVDLGKYEFLDRGLVRAIDCVDGYPTLSRSFETTVPRLHIVGAPAARSHGPLMRFVAGSGFAARAVARGATG